MGAARWTESGWGGVNCKHRRLLQFDGPELRCVECWASPHEQDLTASWYKPCHDEVHALHEYFIEAWKAFLDRDGRTNTRGTD